MEKNTPAPQRKFSLILFLWPATLVAAFFIGRMTLINDPKQATQSTTEAQSSQPTPYEVKKSIPATKRDEDEPIDSAELDPLLQIRSGIAESDPLKRMSMLTDAFSKLTKENILDGMALLESLPDGQLKQQLRTLLLNTWGKLDGPAAMEYVLNNQGENPGGRGLGGGFGIGRGRGGDRFGSNIRDTTAVMSGWAEADPQAAVAWATENGSTERGRNTMLFSALQGWANTDIEGAINYAMTQTTETTGDSGRGGRGGGMENFLINRYVNDNPQAAAQWALSQPDPGVRNDAVGSIARSLANDSPEEAAQWAESISDPVAKAEALQGTASGWARENPQAALDWAFNIEDPDTSNEAVESALSTWVRADPFSASDYVINMDAGTDKDHAAATLSSNMVRQDPEMAALWAESISDPQLQTETATRAVNRWMQQDPTAATEWIESSSLAEDTKVALLTPNQP